MVLTCSRISRPAPNSARLMATVTTTAMVIVRLRRRPTAISDATKDARIGSGPVSVDAAVLVPHDLALRQLDDPTAHRVDDRCVVRGHHDCGPRSVDPVEQLHDPDARVGVEVAGRLV